VDEGVEAFAGQRRQAVTVEVDTKSQTERWLLPMAGDIQRA